jgi:hypothetical protein
MKMVGHKTESIYRRYAIVSEGDLQRAGEQFAALGEPTTKRVVRELTLGGPSVNANMTKRMVGWDGIEPPTPGFSDRGPYSCKCA